jgi:hypothetical protein
MGLLSAQRVFLALKEQGFHGRKPPVLFPSLGMVLPPLPGKMSPLSIENPGA